jgi:uncharacterized protein
MIESPCISVCMINADDERCYGCFRTLDEIASWTNFSDAERAAINAQLEERRAAFDPLADD